MGVPYGDVNDAGSSEQLRRNVNSLCEFELEPMMGAFFGVKPK
jgi:hypothetical protein